MALSAPRGVRDILPVESTKWRWLENQFVEICKVFGYHELRIPFFEATELYQRGVGEATDIVQKEMYTFADRSDRSLTLRPEITAGMARSYIEQKLHAGVQPVKLFTYGPLFRYERPQAGRYRQFHQFDIEAFGSLDPMTDAEIIALGWQFFHKIGLEDIQLQINSIGCEHCRPRLRRDMIKYLEQRLDKLCPDCQKRYLQNPLRVFDCKNETCQAEYRDLPVMRGRFCPDCAHHHILVHEYLKAMGIPYIINDRLVRGLDYYNRTVFEFFDPNTAVEIGALGGGGRYDYLVRDLGGPETPGVGFGLGMERILIALDRKGFPYTEEKLPLFVVTIGEETAYRAIAIVNSLRKKGIKCEIDIMQRSLKAQLRHANKLGAKKVLIIGEDELQNGKLVLRNMETQSQEEIDYATLEEFIEVLRLKLASE